MVRIGSFRAGIHYYARAFFAANDAQDARALAIRTIEPKALYISQGQQYHVERLDFDKGKAYVKRMNVDSFTDAIRYTQVRVLEVAEGQSMLVPQLGRTATCSRDRRLWVLRNQVLRQR